MKNKKGEHLIMRAFLVFNCLLYQVHINT